jgi:hypothetical protein
MDYGAVSILATDGDRELVVTGPKPRTGNFSATGFFLPA